MNTASADGILGGFRCAGEKGDPRRAEVDASAFINEIKTQKLRGRFYVPKEK